MTAEGEYVLVPREASEKMLDAWELLAVKRVKERLLDNNAGFGIRNAVAENYRAMLAARPRHLSEVRRAEEAVIEAAREVVKAHLQGIYPPVDVLMGRLEEYDAALHSASAETERHE